MHNMQRATKTSKTANAISPPPIAVGFESATGDSLPPSLTCVRTPLHHTQIPDRFPCLRALYACCRLAPCYGCARAAAHAMRRAPTRTILKQPPMSYAELADPLFQHGSDPLRVENVPVTRIGIRTRGTRWLEEEN